jgi:hypothetical protein
MRAYKLTDAAGLTRAGYDNETRWGEGVTHTATGDGELCGAGWIHAYEHPLLAVLHDPAHGSYCATPGARLWEAETGETVKRDGQMKLGTTSLTTIREIPLPVVTTAQRVRYAIYCAQAVIGDRCPAWSEWVKDWLSGKDRSEAAGAWAARAAAGAWAEEWAARAKSLNLIALSERAVADEPTILPTAAK